MRAEGCTVTQALTPEAAAVVKQAVILARRRGHAQVTPLHVANTMLSASTGLFRTACLQSHSHPLQCKALELCFNVALNRLPTSTPPCSPMLGANTTTAAVYPSISNALVAAFKRAQAHQRRGSVENQQQPILTVKIEIEQLVISILDDPSVSRVMREAGLSSTQVKNNVEQAVSLEVCSKTSTYKPEETRNSMAFSQNSTQFQTKVMNKQAPVRSEDVMYVINNLANKRRNVVIVGECVETLERVIRAVTERIDRRDVPEELRDVKFITLSFSSFRQLSRTEVEDKLGELKTLLRSCLGKGVILNLGDLNWVADFRNRNSGNLCYAVEHMIMEIAKLACGLAREDGGRFWLMGFATFQTYMRCKSGNPSIESVWRLNALTIPGGGLQLSLISNSEVGRHDACTNKNVESIVPKWLLLGDKDKEKNQLSSSNTLENFHCSSSSLPAWLQSCKNENKTISSNNDKDSASMDELCRKWNSICSSTPKNSLSSENTLTFSPFSSSSSSICDLQNLSQHQSNRESLVTQRRHYNFLISEESCPEPNLTLLVSDNDKVPVKKNSSNPNSTVNSASSNDSMEIEYIPTFKELTAESLSTLCDALEKKVPLQKNMISEISRTILKCRSGMVRRIDHKTNEPGKEETWLFFQGADFESKEKIARELARTVFGSRNHFVLVGLSSFSSSKPDSTQDFRNKRSRDENCWSYIGRFCESVSRNPHRVFFVEDIEQADYISQMGFRNAIERGKISNATGEDVSFGDAIVILSCERFSSRSRGCSPPIEQKFSDDSDQKKEESVAKSTGSPCLSLDLNLSINEDAADDETESMDEIGLLEVVDGLFNFKIMCNEHDDS